MHVLVVDDEQLLVKGIKFNLENDGYTVDSAYDGEQALVLASQNKYDIIILDLMLPGLSGLEVCRRVREFSSVPVIMLTAKGDDTDKLIGFEYGADDYVTKPFNILELKARIRAIIRRHTASGIKRENREVRSEPDPNATLKAGHIVLDLNQRVAFVDGEQTELTLKEFDMLELLMKNPGRVFSRENLLNTVWGYEYLGDVRTVDVHIRRLREKIEKNPAEPAYILTRWGVGYYFKA